MALEYTYDVNKHQEGCIIITKRIVTRISLFKQYMWYMRFYLRMNSNVLSSTPTPWHPLFRLYKVNILKGRFSSPFLVFPKRWKKNVFVRCLKKLIKAAASFCDVGILTFGDEKWVCWKQLAHGLNIYCGDVIYIPILCIKPNICFRGWNM